MCCARKPSEHTLRRQHAGIGMAVAAIVDSGSLAPVPTFRESMLAGDGVQSKSGMGSCADAPQRGGYRCLRQVPGRRPKDSTEAIGMVARTAGSNWDGCPYGRKERMPNRECPDRTGVVGFRQRQLVATGAPCRDGRRPRAEGISGALRPPPAARLAHVPRAARGADGLEGRRERDPGKRGGMDGRPAAAHAGSTGTTRPGG